MVDFVRLVLKRLTVKIEICGVLTESQGIVRLGTIEDISSEG